MSKDIKPQGSSSSQGSFGSQGRSSSYDSAAWKKANPQPGGGPVIHTTRCDVYRGRNPEILKQIPPHMKEGGANKNKSNQK